MIVQIIFLSLSGNNSKRRPFKKFSWTGRKIPEFSRFSLSRVGTDLRIDTIFPESQLKKDMFFPDRLVERSIIFQTTETIKHPFIHGTFFISGQKQSKMKCEN